MAIRRLLIANRGEIAVRIVRACRELGVESVAVYSDADRAALHVQLADRAERIGPAAASASYLSIDSVIHAARRSGADAVHPGYGFLAENAAFAAACADAGLTFVGPPADVIERMGSKLGARALMERSNVPVVPGLSPDDQTEAGVRAAALRIGTPLLIKASAGGGGKGMRTVHASADLDEAIAAARREAIAAFGDGTLYVERLVTQPRHIEVQVMADGFGGVTHVFERECSVQRRHQKVIEETPSVALTPRLRREIGDAAVRAAAAASYQNAGTIEFLLEGGGDEARFYFLEMNTRLQVEHPITEEVAGVDLVRAQIAIAGGARLPWTSDTLTQRGHAIECRVYAEDPDQGYLPQAGPLLVYREPAGPGIRVDGGVREGDAITVHYDPLLAKLIARADTRDAAIARASAALRQFAVLGIRTNVPFLIAVLNHPRFRAGEIDTHFLDAEGDRLQSAASPVQRRAAAAAAAWTSLGGDRGATASAAGTRAGAAATARVRDPWDGLEAAR